MPMQHYLLLLSPLPAGLHRSASQPANQRLSLTILNSQSHKESSTFHEALRQPSPACHICHRPRPHCRYMDGECHGSRPAGSSSPRDHRQRQRSSRRAAQRAGEQPRLERGLHWQSSPADIQLLREDTGRDACGWPSHGDVWHRRHAISHQLEFCMEQVSNNKRSACSGHQRGLGDRRQIRKGRVRVAASRGTGDMQQRGQSGDSAHRW